MQEVMDDLSVANINNAGPNVNSIENDITPFFHQPSNRLYFSSTWHNGYGGFDVFSVTGMIQYLKHQKTQKNQLTLLGTIFIFGSTIMENMAM